MNDTIDGEVARYATAVRAAFADLPAPGPGPPGGGRPRWSGWCAWAAGARAASAGAP